MDLWADFPESSEEPNCPWHHHNGNIFMGGLRGTFWSVNTLSDGMLVYFKLV